MARQRSTKPKQAPPISFRAGRELGPLATRFATEQKLGVNEVFRDLAALALAELDIRYFVLLAELAAAMSGPSALVRAALHVHTALSAAARVDATILREPRRTQFVVDTVQQGVSAEGLSLAPETVSRLFTSIGYLPALTQPTDPDLGPPPKKVKVRRKVRFLPKDDPAPADPVSAEDEIGQPNWDSIGWSQEQRERQRLGQ